jgi:hypothetical protein
MTRDTFTQFLTDVLYKCDPAQVFCVENELFNEYSSEAEYISELIYDSNFEVKQAMAYVFQKQFDGHFSTSRLMNAYKIVNEKLC